MSDKKQKIITKSKIPKNKEKNKTKKPKYEIILDETITPRTKQIISTFIKSIIEDSKKNDDKKKYLSPVLNRSKKKINHQDELSLTITPKENRRKIFHKNHKRERSNSAQKFKNKNKHNMVNNFNKKNYFRQNKTSYTITNALNTYENGKKDIKENHKKLLLNENNLKSPANKETIGQKMIREEIAKEKKMTSEKLKIIKEHILSLQKKEEELEKKMIKLNNQENALNKKNIQKEDDKEDNKDKDIEKDKEKEKEKEKEKGKEKEKEKEIGKSPKEQKKKSENIIKESLNKDNNEAEKNKDKNKEENQDINNIEKEKEVKEEKIEKDKKQNIKKNKKIALSKVTKNNSVKKVNNKPNDKENEKFSKTLCQKYKHNKNKFNRVKTPEKKPRNDKSIGSSSNTKIKNYINKNKNKSKNNINNSSEKIKNTKIKDGKK